MESKSVALFTRAKNALLSQLYNEIPDNGAHYTWIMCKINVAKNLTYESYIEAINVPAKNPTTQFDELNSVISSIKTEMAKLDQKENT